MPEARQTALVVGLIFFGSLSSGCFTELRSRTCEISQDCFEADGESCIEGMCVSRVEPDGLDLGYEDASADRDDAESSSDGSRDSGGMLDLPDASSPQPRFVEVATSNYGACALSSDGRVFCWGNNWGGNARAIMEAPDGLLAPTHVATSFEFSTITAGLRHYCGITLAGEVASRGEVICWGLNGGGQVSGRDNSAEFPTRVDLEAGVYVSLSAGHNHTCARRSDNSVHCWGSNEEGQLARMAASSGLAPDVVPGIAAQSISAGSNHTCAIEVGTDELKCWGYNLRSAVRAAACPNTICPISRSGGMQTYGHVSAGLFATCGINGAGEVVCWGMNNDGSLGLGAEDIEVSEPTKNGVMEADHVSMGSSHGCALLGSGQPSCWGAKSSSEAAGMAERESVVPPRLMETDLRFSSIDTGDKLTCGVTLDGAVFCWGSNTDGRLNGETDPVSSHIPVQVLSQPPDPD